MGQRSNNRRMVLSAVGLAIFLILSSFIGSFLLAKDAKAGGLDVEWRVPLPNGFSQMLRAEDGSLIVKGDEGPIMNIDRNGTVIWSFDGGYSEDLSFGPEGNVYFVEREGYNDSIYCLFINGTLNWRFETDKLFLDIHIGADGNIYFIENPGSDSVLVCLTSDGMVTWEYDPRIGDVSRYPFAVFSDGTVLVRNTEANWSISADNPRGGYITTVDELVSVSSNGTVMWTMDLLSETGDSGICVGPMITGNGTAQLVFTTNGTQTFVGLDRDGSVEWTFQCEHYATPGTAGPGDALYLIENYEDQPWGYPEHVVNRITSWNTANGTLNWQRVMEGWAYGPVAMCDNASIFILNGELVRLSSNGGVEWYSGFFIYDLSRTTILDDDGNCGLLIASGSNLYKIESDGSRPWQYRLDSPVKAGVLGPDGSMMVITNGFVISIHKAVLTTTMNYFVVLLAIDLFVTLMSAVWMFDLMWPKDKARIE